MNSIYEYLGRVTAGRFEILLPEVLAGTSRRLTAMGMQVAQPPEAQEVKLDEYNGRVIMVRGHADSEWIWSAEVVDTAGPILTAVAEKVLGEAAKAAEVVV